MTDKSPNTPEPPPQPSDRRPAWDLVIEDMRERDRMGTAKYGQRLTPGDGRNSLVDAYQEALDLAVYLRKRIDEERVAEPANVPDEVSELMSASDQVTDAITGLTEATETVAELIGALCLAGPGKVQPSIVAQSLDRMRSCVEDGTPPLPRIVCLCGSTRFRDHFARANYEETMKGHIVLSVGFFPGSKHGEGVGCTPEQKVALDELHKRKIDLADEILVLNVKGYVGESTASEIAYASRTGKPIRWLEPRVIGQESPLPPPSDGVDSRP